MSRTPVLLALLAILVAPAMAGPAGQPDTSDVGAADTADLPYTNAAQAPQDTLPTWSVEASFSGSRSPDSALQTNWTTQVTRAWHRGDWEPSLDLGWTRAARGSLDSALWHLGGGVDWNFTEIWTLGVTTAWTPVRDERDDASASIGLSASDRIWDPLGADGSVTGTWDRISRGDLQVELGVSPAFGWSDGRLAASFERTDQTYLDVTGAARSEYLNVWGWSALWTLHRGKWSTGPSWSGDYWKVNASASTARKQRKNGLIGASRKIPASGKALDQQFLWNLSWKPLTGIVVSLDAFRTTGGEVVKPKAGATALQKSTLSNWTAATALPEDAVGARSTLSVSW